MVDSEHLAKLKGGVKDWNQWRANASIAPALFEVNLSGMDLSGYNLIDADLRKANLSRASLVEAKLIRADLKGANLGESSLEDADLSFAQLYAVNLTSARLARADLMMATMRSADLTDADLSQAGLSQANLAHSKLCGANLNQTELLECNLQKADLSRSCCTGAIFGHTLFADNDLSTATGLAAASHFAPSTLGIDTIYRSKGRIPEEFLRGCGVSDHFITYARSLVVHPIEFYSCFISYSTKDGGFANRLYADLQQEGVRCWFAPEDLKIGDRFQEQIEESIRLYDKLLLVLSDNSINSAWVEREVQAAFEKERRQGSTVLFPVRLDDAVMDSPRAWAADIRRTRHIGDFRKWKDHDSFQKSLERLLRDLKSQDSKPKLA